MAPHQNLPVISVSIILLTLGISSSSASISSRLQPSPSPMATPYRNDHPVIYSSAFYDPKYHSLSIFGEDESRTSKTLPTQTTKTRKQPTTPTSRTFTLEEKFAILQKYQMLQNALKFKRGIANSVDFTGDGDSLAVETRDSLAMESDGSPKIVVRAKKVSPSGSIITNQHRANKDQIQSESKKNIKVDNKPNSFHPQQTQSYYDNHSTGAFSTGGFVNQAKDEFVHGRRKMRAHYFRRHKTPSLGKAFVEVKSRIGYW